LSPDTPGNVTNTEIVRLPTVPRDRLIRKLDAVSSARLRLIVGPPGAGKTTVLRQLAASTGNAGQLTGWCDVVPASFVPTLARSLGPVLGRNAGRISQLGTLLARLAAIDSELVIFLDDAHRVAGWPAEHALTELVGAAPPNVRFVMASRDERIPDPARFDAGAYRIGYPELMFRTWEVERLFRDAYQRPLPPDAAATLCAQLEGWPAALGLFHVDTALLAEPDRLAASRAPVAACDRIGHYLAEIVGGLPDEPRALVTSASLLGVLDGALCDVVLDRTGSAELLDTLAARGLLHRVGPSLRFPVPLQQYLERRFAQLKGPHLTRQAYHHAAVQLLNVGHWVEAYRCYAHAEDWVTAAGVLHRFNARPGGLYASASISTTLLHDDPWIALADARRLRGEGRFSEACERYLDAENLHTDPRLRWQCALERSTVARWIVDDSTSDSAARGDDPLVDDVSGYLLAALRGHPARLLTRPLPEPTPAWTLGRAVAALLDGRVASAAELVVPLISSPDAFVSLAGRIIAAICARGGSLAEFRVLATEAETAGWLWLARLARAAGALRHADGCADAQAVLAECRELGDVWGELASGFLLAIGCLRTGQDGLVPLRDALALARRLGVAVIETWLQLSLVEELDRRGDPSAGIERARRDHLLAATKLSVPGTAPAPVTIRCFGRYQLLVGGREVDLSTLRRQPRRLLGVLSVHYGQPVHEERLVAALWPDAPLKLAKRRLQVAVSSLRVVLRSVLPAPSAGLVRQGGAYVLRLPAGSTIDVAGFAEAMRRWRLARGRTDRAQLIALANRVLESYRGELLSEEGSAEWVLARRESMRGEASGVAAALARLELDRGDPAAAIEICQRALGIDELDSRVWTVLTEARRRTEGAAAARRTEQTYWALVADV
jgi:DNA-binding SARP family transcriptional activator